MDESSDVVAAHAPAGAAEIGGIQWRALVVALIMMSKKLIALNGGWGILCVAAFLIGSQSPDSRGGRDDKADEFVARVPGSAFAPSLEKSKPLAEQNRKAKGDSVSRQLGMNVSGRAGLNDLATKAVRSPNPIERRLAFSELLGSMTADNALEMREQLLSLGVEGEQWRDFNYAWGALAGEEAFRFAAASDERDLGAAVAGWASANPGDAIRMLDNLPDDLKDQREDLARSVVEGVSDTDREMATDLVLRLAQEGVAKTDELIATVARDALRVGGAKQAASWSLSLPDGALKGAAMQEVAQVYAREDPRSAASWTESVAAEEFAARAVEEVGRQWARSEPVDAVGWLETLPQGSGQTSGLRSAFGDWEDSDPLAATEYLSGMSDSTQRDAAISGFSRGYAWQDPEVAIAWALDISDPKLRQDSLVRAGQIFLRRDRQSATQWLQNSALPVQTVEAIVNSREG